MIIAHYSEVAWWDKSRWPNFSPRELACRHCGELYLDPASIDALQQARSLVGRPFIIHSAHRCPIHNARVGGAPLSQHKKIAFDIGLAGHGREDLLGACLRAGFRGVGFYGTFLHVDLGRRRRWWSKQGEKRWNGLLMY